MGDDLEAILATDEAAIRADGFSARVAKSSRIGTRTRRSWLITAGAIGFGVAALSVARLTEAFQANLDWAASIDVVLRIPGVEMALPIHGATLMALGIGAAMLITTLAAKVADDGV